MDDIDGCPMGWDSLDGVPVDDIDGVPLAASIDDIDGMPCECTIATDARIVTVALIMSRPSPGVSFLQ